VPEARISPIGGELPPESRVRWQTHYGRARAAEKELSPDG